jgi:D-alanine transaminase
MTVYLNGAYLPREKACISVDDRGFLFGDGVYEVIRAYNGAFFEAEDHFRRMERGLRNLGIRLPEAIETGVLLAVATRLLQENELAEGEATVYVQVTRGAAPRTHQFPPSDTPATVYASVSRFLPRPELAERGVGVITHADLRWKRCDLKAVTLLPNVLAKQAAVDAGATEAILVRDGQVTEGASTNVFGVHGGKLRTHPESGSILSGVTRRVVMELATERGITVSETAILEEELTEMDELFLTGTTTDVLPITRVDGRAIGDGRPGPVTRVLQHALAARMKGVVSAR